jgi:hypothetical protein
MRTRLMRMCPFILNSLLAGQAMAQLFYDDCTGGQCRKAFIEKKEKIGDELYLIKTIFLTYHQRGTTNADEESRNAKISCNKARPTVTWGAGKAQMVDKRVFARSAPKKKHRVVEPEKPEKFDETTSLWKKVCFTH